MIIHDPPPLRLHNFLTDRKEILTVRDNHVGVYVCGITPYDASHLGHAFTYVHFDVLIRDLIFPHHECSIAQTECALAEPLARCWLHPAMVTNQAKKMSKSEGNMIFVKDLQKVGADAARLCILACHYRRTWNFQHGDIRRAENLADLFRQVGRRQSGLGGNLDPSPYEHRFLAALSDDLDTPGALRTMEQLAREILRDASRRVAAAKGFINRACNLLGIRLRFGN